MDNIGEEHKQEIIKHLSSAMLIINKIEKDDNFTNNIRFELREQRLILKEIKTKIMAKKIWSFNEKEMGTYYRKYRYSKK